MVDYNQLSDEELLAAYNAKTKPTLEKKPEEMTDDELVAAYEAKKTAKPTQDQPALAALQGFGKEATLGYLPEMQAGLAKLLPSADPETDAKLAAMGIKETPETFKGLTESFRSRQKGLEESNPTAFLAGQAGGMGAQGLIGGAAAGKALGAMKAAPLVGKAVPTVGGLGAGVLESAATGGAYNPEETGTSRTEGALGGAAAAGLLGGAGKAIKGLAGSAKDLGTSAGMRSLGAIQGDVKKLQSRGIERPQELAKFIKEKGLVAFGDDVDTTFNKATQLKSNLGSQIGEIHKSLSGKAGTFDPVKVGDEALSSIKASVKGKANGSEIAQNLDPIINNFKDLPPDASLKDLLSFKSSLDDVIYKDKMGGLGTSPPAKTEALKKVRDYISNQIDTSIKNIPGEEGKALKNLNKEYGLASDAVKISGQQVAREKGNNIIGLRAGIGGAALGGGALATQGEITPESLGKAAAFGLMPTIGQKYGMKAAASALPAIGSALEPLGKGLLKSSSKGGLLYNKTQEK